MEQNKNKDQNSDHSNTQNNLDEPDKDKNTNNDTRLSNQISFSDFKKLDIRIGEIKSAEKVENADKLLKLIVDFGEFERQVVSGIAEWYEPQDLVGKKIPVLINLEYAKFRGVESQGMILAAGEEGKPILLYPSEDIEKGAKIL